MRRAEIIAGDVDTGSRTAYPGTPDAAGPVERHSLSPALTSAHTDANGGM